MDRLDVVTTDGWSLGVRRLGSGRRVALLLHAMMVDHRSMDRPEGEGLASRLARSGWEVWLADFRGRGMSGPPPPFGGEWSYDDLVYRDVPALVRAAGSDGRPVVVFGHSLGGHVSAASAASGTPMAGLVLIAANVWLPRLEPDPAARAVKHAAVLAMRGAARRWGWFPARHLGMGPADESLQYVEQMTGYWFADRWGSADGRVDWLDAARAWTGPALAVLGAGDRLLARPDAAAAWASRLGPRGAETWLVGDGRYGVAGRPDHMGLVTDPRYSGWWSSLVAWLDARWGA